MSFERFYSNESTELGKNAEQVAQEIYTEPASLAAYAECEAFFKVALPSRYDLEAGVDLTRLYTDVELQKRYIEIVLGLLGRLGFKLITLAPRPAFLMLKETDEFALTTPERIATDTSASPRNAYLKLLDKILRSLSALGFADITIALYNLVFTLHARNDKFQAKEWFRKQTTELAADISYSGKVERNVAKAVEIRKLFPQIAKPPPLATLYVNSRAIPRCEHGIYMRPQTKAGRNRMVCLLASIDDSNELACKKSIPHVGT